MKAAELRSKTIEELKQSLISLRKEGFNFRMQRANGQLDGLSKTKVLRRDIARIKTIITEKQAQDAPRS